MFFKKNFVCNNKMFMVFPAYIIDTDICGEAILGYWVTENFATPLPGKFILVPVDVHFKIIALTAHFQVTSYF